ncbi:cytochrome P450 [Lactifluus volemus]|nr:cytochrome P450 [Lactifluus volemus]
MSDDFPLKAALFAGVFILISLFLSWYRRDPLLEAIPTIGFSDPVLSYISAARFTLDGVRMLREGYEKTRPGLFKIPFFRRWVVLAAGPELIEDMRRAPDNVLNMIEPVFEDLQANYTFKLLNLDDSYHADIIRSKLTRNIANTFKQVHEELLVTFDDLIQTHDNHEWIKIPIVETMQRVVCAISNRVFVGVPLCRNRDYQDLNLSFAINVVKFGMVLSMFPKPLRPIISRMLSNIPSQIRQETEFIRPMVEERFAKMEEFGEDWDDKPNDMLMWLMSEAKGVERSLDGLARRLLTVNFASIHTTSLTAAQVLYRLLSNPECIEPLREEVEAVVAEEGWTKAAMDKMYKIDSLVRETQRLDGLGLLSVSRLVLRPFTFSNGVTVPPGTLVAAPACAALTDEEVFTNPDQFDGFRFSKLRGCDEDAAASRHQVVSISAKHLAFGLGRHACPGRFFAATELKAMLAHMILTYDMKFEEGKGAPSGLCFAAHRIPGRTNVMFRKRQA